MPKIAIIGGSGLDDPQILQNATEKKIEKADTLRKQWPQYVELKMRFNRPHHFVDWKKHFKHILIKNY